MTPEDGYKGKAPSFQFYPSDWIRDLSEHSLEIEGAWIRICAHLFYSETKGTSEKSLKNWSNILRLSCYKSQRIIAYLDNQKIADVVIQTGGIRITSRRMVRDEYIKEIRRQSGSLGGNPALKSAKKVEEEEAKNALDLLILKRTPSSSSSSSSSDSKSLGARETEKSPPRVFSPPTVAEVSEYRLSRIKEGHTPDIDPQGFIDHYQAKDWMLGKNRVKDWKACYRTWETKRKMEGSNGKSSGKYESANERAERELQERHKRVMQRLTPGS